MVNAVSYRQMASTNRTLVQPLDDRRLGELGDGTVRRSPHPWIKWPARVVGSRGRWRGGLLHGHAYYTAVSFVRCLILKDTLLWVPGKLSAELMRNRTNVVHIAIVFVPVGKLPNMRI